MFASSERSNPLLCLFKMRRIAGDQRGLALAKVLVLAALLALILPVGMVILQNAFERQKVRSTQERYVAMVMSLRRQLEDPISCVSVLGGLVIPSGLNDRVPVTINWKFTDEDPSLELERVEIRRTGGVFNDVRLKNAGVSTTYQTVPIRIYAIPARVNINLSDAPGGVVEPPEQFPFMIRSELMIRLNANVDGSNRIVSCFGANSAAAACEAMGGGYNVAGPANLRCQPDKICFTGIAGLVTDPAGCLTFGIPYRARSVGKNVSGQTEYLCSLCHNDL